MTIKFLVALTAIFVFLSCSSPSNPETTNKNSVNISVSPSPIATQNTTIANNSATNKTDKTTSSTQIKNFDPFIGSVSELMPSQVGDYLKDKPESDTEMKYYNNTKDARKDLYRVKGNDRDSIVLSISNYSSSEAAQDVVKKVAIEQKLPTAPKMKNGKKVGIRISAGNGTNLIWTNGSLVCYAMSNGDIKADVVKSFEDKLSF